MFKLMFMLRFRLLLLLMSIEYLLNSCGCDNPKLDDQASAYTRQDKHYHFFHGPITWDKAGDSCKYHGGSLATIRDRGELHFLIDISASDGNFWIGAKSEDGKNWKWVDDDEPVANYIWPGGQPVMSNSSICAYIPYTNLTTVASTSGALTDGCKLFKNYLCNLPSASSSVIVTPTFLGYILIVHPFFILFGIHFIDIFLF